MLLTTMAFIIDVGIIVVRYCCMQDVTEKIEQHKDIIDANNKSFYEMKKAKDAKQNERKYACYCRHSVSLFCFFILLLCLSLK